jgi:hypothetical protein
MSFVSKAIGSITGANKQAKAAQQAANTQAAATDRASEVQKEMYNQTREDLAPYTQAGNKATTGMMNLLGLGTGSSADALAQDPSYQFRLNQGLEGVQSSAAAGGGLLSGATLKALNNYAQDQASQEYGNAFNRLYGVSSLGQNAAAQVGNTGTSVAQSIANNTMAGANAMAAGQVAAGNRTANNFGAALNVANVASKFFSPI